MRSTVHVMVKCVLAAALAAVALCAPPALAQTAASPWPQRLVRLVVPFGAFGGFLGWRDMPDALRERIAAIRMVGADASIAATLAAAGVGVRTSTEFAAAIAEERAKVTAIAKAVGTTPAQ